MIKKMLKDFPLSSAVLFFIVYLPLFLVDYLMWKLDGELPIEITHCRLGLLSFWAAVLGFSRIGSHHPGCDRSYLKWLALTPWKFGKPLPRGPMFMNFMDGIILAVLTLLAYLNGNYHTPAPLVAYLGAYTLIAMLHLLIAKKNNYILAFLFILPLAIYPHSNINITFLVVVILYGLAHAGTISWLKEFPWNTSIWNYDQRKKLLDTALKGTMLNGHYKLLRVVDFNSAIKKGEALTVCLLVTWWLHVANNFFVDSILLFYSISVFGAALIRFVAYASNCEPPINLWTRVFTRRFIIPGYDKVMIAPLCITLVGVLMPYLLRHIGLSMRFALEISFFSFMMIAFTLPPSLKEWHLNGFHGIFLRPRRMQHADK
jgi:hypothetical protein